MRVKCEYCRQMIDEGLEKCPYCGATISAVNRVADKQPKTIEELQEWYKAHNLPPEEVTRFFIGKDYKQPKAFGIYKDINGDFVVYKNKADGTRAIRYQGVDEGYAVNELYQRLKAEIADQKSHQKPKTSNGNEKTYRFFSNLIDGFLGNIGKYTLIFFGIFFALAILVAIFDKSPSNGYYRYKGNDYYYQDSYWYRYDPLLDDWLEVDDDDELDSAITSDTENDYDTYWDSGSRFEDTNWFDSGSSDDNDDWDSDSYWDDDDDWSWDSDDSWDSGSDWDSWDSGSDYSSDWDSDW